MVQGESSQFTHLFQNLLSNSMKYVRANITPEIDISALRDGDNWVVSFSDNGIGFEPEFAQKIFGLFKRLHKNDIPGSGFGLAICQRILERYRGRIWAECRPDPATPSAAPPDCQPPLAPPNKTSRTVRKPH